MLRQHGPFFARLHTMVDMALTILAFFFAYAVRYYLVDRSTAPLPPLKDFIWILLIIFPIWWLLLEADMQRYRYRLSVFKQLFGHTFLVVLKGGTLLLIILLLTGQLKEHKELIGLFSVFDAGFLSQNGAYALGNCILPKTWEKFSEYYPREIRFYSGKILRKHQKARRRGHTSSRDHGLGI